MIIQNVLYTAGNNTAQFSSYYNLILYTYTYSLIAIKQFEELTGAGQYCLYKPS